MCELSWYAWMSHSDCKFAEECERGGGDPGASWKTALQCRSAYSVHCLILLMTIVNIWNCISWCIIAIFCNLKFALLKWDPDRCFTYNNFLEALCFETQLLCLLESILSSFLIKQRGYLLLYSWSKALFYSVCWNVCNVNLKINKQNSFSRLFMVVP